MSGVLVIGAAGLIGREILAEARRAGVVAQAVVASPSPSVPDAHVLRLSTGAVDDLTRLLARVEPTAIVNGAGRTAGTPEELWEANVEPVAALLEAMRVAAPAARLVHLGSAAEYAESDDDRTAEDALLEGATPYAESKVAASRLVNEAAESGLDTVVARVFNPLGPGMPATSLPGLAAGLIRGAVAERAAEIELGPLDAVRDYVDVRDVAAAALVLATEPRLAHAAYNVGTGRATVVRDLVALIAERAGFSGRILETAAGQVSGVKRQVADTARIRSTGWSPAVEMGDSVDALLRGSSR